jgi:hypothetical protein
LLRPFRNLYRHALILLDHDGCGREAETPEKLESELEARLDESGWEGRARAIVLDPELEIWVWTNSAHVLQFVGWKGDQPALTKWLTERSYLKEGQSKPERSQEAVEELLRLARLPRSSSRYFEISQKVSLHRCEDRAFLKLRDTLKGWFPA